MQKQQWQGLIGLIIATLIWGMTFAFIKDAIATIKPFNFLFWRFGLATILLLIIFWKKLNFNYRNLTTGSLLGLFLAGTVIFQTIGLQYTNASTASFITGLSVILVAIFESMRNKKAPSLYLIIAIIFALTGLALITLKDGLSINKGDFWVLLCAFCFAFYILLAGSSSQKRDTLSLTFVQSLTVCSLSLILSFTEGGLSIPQEHNVWVSLLFCAIFASIIAFILQIHYQQFVSASKAAIIFALEPVFATIAAAIYLSEHLTLQFYIGSLLIFLSILFSEKKAKQKIIPQD